MTEVAESRVHDLLARAVMAGRAPGAVALWVHGSGPQHCCFEGRSDLRETPRDVTADTWFDLASLTKPLVTTTLSLLAFREGVLTPDTRVAEVLCETGKSPLGDLEVHDLLTHTSGLPAWLPLYCLAEGRRERISRVLQRVAVESRPGAKVLYSCIGFVVLGLMLEELSGSRLEDLFRRRVIIPLGLEEHLGFHPDPDLRPVAGGATRPTAEERLVLDLGLDPEWIPAVGTGLPDDGNARFLGGAAGNAGLFGTAHGVSRLTAQYFGSFGGTLLSGEEVEPAVTSHTGGLEQERGWGWQMASSPGCSAGAAMARTAFGHTGFTGVSVWAEPVNGDIWVLLSNRNHPAQRGVDLHPLRRRFHALATPSPA